MESDIHKRTGHNEVCLNVLKVDIEDKAGRVVGQ